MFPSAKRSLNKAQLPMVHEINVARPKCSQSVSSLNRPKLCEPYKAENVRIYEMVFSMSTYCTQRSPMYKARWMISTMDECGQ